MATFKEIIEKIAALSKEIEASIGKDATVMPHKWDLIRSLGQKMANTTKALNYIPTPPKPFVKPEVPQLEQPEAEAEPEARGLIAATDPTKTRKPRK
jgi:hypothetical protein